MKISLEIDDKKAMEFLSLLHSGLKVETECTPIINKKVAVQEPTGEETAEAQKVKIVEEKKPLSLEDARKILTTYTRSGYSEEVKALVEKYGNGKLSAVKSENYPALLCEAKYTCRAPLTKEEVTARVEELKTEGYSDKLSALFEHHNATSVDDLKSEYYSSFMRDAEEIDYAGN